MAVQLGDELAHGRVSKRGLPTAVGEVAAGIFFRPPGRLHHAVEGQERLHGELHVLANVAGLRSASVPGHESPGPKLSSIGHAIVQVDDSAAEVLLIEQLKVKPLVVGEGLFAASQ